MKKIIMNSNNICKFNNNNQYFIRTGIWNHMEIVLDKEEFERNDSDFKEMIIILNKLYNGETINEEEYKYDGYMESIINQLIQYDVLSEILKNNISDNIDKNLLVVESEFEFLVEKMTDDKVMTVVNLENILDDNLLTNLDYLKKSSCIEEATVKLAEFNHINILLSKPNLNLLEKFNKLAICLEKTWTVGYVDGNIASFSSFNKDFTACFECLEQHNSVRMNNYNSYLEYKKQEKMYQKKSVSKTDFWFIFFMLKKINEINFFDISTPLEGKTISIYLPNFEMYTERIMRSPMCTSCGHVSQSVSSDFNLRTENILKNIL